MINKYQAGGATQGGILQELAKLPKDQQKKIMTAFGKWAQTKGMNIQQLQNDPQALEQAMGQFLQEMQSQAPKARLGAKLNYVKELKGGCPEGQEVVYFQKGGMICKKCAAKQEKGGKADKPNGRQVIANFKKQKACGGAKVRK